MYSVLFLFVFVFTTHSKQIPFDRIVSFGDSNTDTGNVYHLTNFTWPIVPPYFQGRFSNGPVWIENLGVTDLKNYAYGGATTDNDFIQGYTASDTKPVPGVHQQIFIYLNSTNSTNRNFTRTLYVIWIGGNDYYFNSTITPSAVVNSTLNGIKDLLHIGVKHLLIINQAPSHVMPFVKTEERMNHYKQRAIYHNQNLSIGIHQLDYNRKEISLYLFDIYSLILNIFADNSTYPLNTKDYCWEIKPDAITVQCSNPAAYAYIDQYHFSARMHELIGDHIRSYLLHSSAISKFSFSMTFVSLLAYEILFFSSLNLIFT